MLTPELESRLDHLSQIIRKLPLKDARWILTELESDIYFNREALRFLARHSFNPAELLEKLTQEELKLVLKKLSNEILKPFFKENIENKSLLESTVGKTKYSDVMKTPKEADALTSSAEIMDSLYEQIGEGKVSYNGIALYFYTPNCRPSKPSKISGSCFFQIMNPLVREGEGIKLFIFDPEHAGAYARISLQNTGKRYFNSESWFLNFTLDQNGIYYGEINPDRTSGPSTVWLDIAGREMCRTVYFTGAKSSYNLNILRHSVEKNILEIEAELIVKSEKKKSDHIKSILYCSRCGSPLGTGKFPISNNKLTLKFEMNEDKLSHEHDFYIHSFYDESQSISRINIFNRSSGRIETEEFIERKPGEEIKPPLNAKNGETILYHVSSSKIADNNARLAFMSSELKFSGAAEKNFNRRPSSLEMSLNDSELVLLSDSFDSAKFGIIYLYGEEKGFTYNPIKWENISDLYFTFYRLKFSELTPIYSCVSRITKESLLYPHLPSYLGKNEWMELEVGYIAKEEGNIFVRNSSIPTKLVKGKGIFTVSMEYGDEPEVVMEISGREIVKKIKLSERSIERKKIAYIPPNTTIQNNGSVYTLYSSPDVLYKELLDKYILSYPWGCGEQTAAKIAGFGILLYKSLPVEKDHFLIKRIQSGIKALEQYKSKENQFYAIFASQPADKQSTILIYNNLQLLFPYRKDTQALVPELWTIIDNMKKTIESSKEKVEVTSKGRSELPQLTNLFGEENVMEAMATTVTEENGKLKNIKGSIPSLAAKSLYCMSVIFDKKEKTIEIFASKEKKKEEYSSGGIRGMVEDLGILDKPVKETVIKKTKKLSGAFDYLLPASEIVFVNDNFPSTIDLSGLLQFLEKVRTKVDSYKYSNVVWRPDSKNTISADKKTTVQSEYTFAQITQKLSDLSPTHSLTPQLTLSKKNLKKGEILSIKFKRRHPTEIYTFLLPVVLEPIYESEFGELLSDKIQLSPFYKNEGISFRASRKGSGRLKILANDMYNTGNAYILDMDMIEVE